MNLELKGAPKEKGYYFPQNLHRILPPGYRGRIKKLPGQERLIPFTRLTQNL